MIYANQKNLLKQVNQINKTAINDIISIKISLLLILNKSPIRYAEYLLNPPL